MNPGKPRSQKYYQAIVHKNMVLMFLGPRGYSDQWYHRERQVYGPEILEAYPQK